MLNRLIIIKRLFAVVIVLLCSCTTRQKHSIANDEVKLPYTLIVTQRSEQDSGWGYIILHNNRQLIRQFYIPAMDGSTLFANSKQAAAVGELVVNKLNHAQRPGISKHELDSLGIIQLTYAKQEK